MIARFRCFAPTHLLIRPSDELKPFDIAFDGTRCRVFPPIQLPRSQGTPDLRGDPADPSVASVTVDGLATFVADAIQIDIYGDFDRRDTGRASDVTTIAFGLLQRLFARLRSGTACEN